MADLLPRPIRPQEPQFRIIGDPLREIEAEDIRRANKLMYAASGLGLGLAAVLLAGIYLLF